MDNAIKTIVHVFSVAKFGYQLHTFRYGGPNGWVYGQRGHNQVRQRQRPALLHVV